MSNKERPKILLLLLHRKHASEVFRGASFTMGLKRKLEKQKDLKEMQ
jgi:hypothetical protein